MERTGWEHYELEKEMANSNMAQLLELFKREDEKCIVKAMEYVDLKNNLTDEGRKAMEEEFKLLREGKEKVAVSIAEKLTRY